MDIVNKINELGAFFGLTIPEEYGRSRPEQGRDVRGHGRTEPPPHLAWARSGRALKSLG